MRNRAPRRLLAALVIAAAAVPLGTVPAGAATDTTVYVIRLHGVTASKDAVAQVAGQMIAKDGGTLRRLYYSAIQGFSVSLTSDEYPHYLKDPHVSSITADRTYTVADVQDDPPSWGQDRIDQRDLPLDGSYSYPNTASNVTAYVVDAGIRVSHDEFGGRASGAYDAINDVAGGQNDLSGTDCNGHGTAVAATLGGSWVGVAKQVRIESVRAFGCDGTGTMEQLMSAVDWINANAQRPAIVNLSFSGPSGSVLDLQLYEMENNGIAYTAAAGNGDSSGTGQDACDTTPARQTHAITVSATDDTDTRPSWANYGTCVHLFAPGVHIVTATNDSDCAYTVLDGTSMAAAEVAGVAAMYLSEHPATNPFDLDKALTAAATTGHVQNPGTGSPNLLAYDGF